MKYADRARMVGRYLAYFKATNPPGTQQPNARPLIRFVEWQEKAGGFRLAEAGEDEQPGATGRPE